MAGCDLIIKNGQAVLEKGLSPVNIIICNGQVNQILPRTVRLPKARRIIDATGLLILPGLIDAHTHYNLHLGKTATNSDSFLSGSAAAACGGVTTILDYTGQGPGVSLSEGLKARQKEAAGQMFVDYSFHAVVPSWKSLKNPETQIQQLMKLGVTSFKFFGAYASRGLMASNAELLSALTASKKNGALICLHAETGEMIDFLTRSAAKNKLGGMAAHEYSRPDFTEWEAVRAALTLAKQAGGKIYFVHLSSSESANLIRKAKNTGILAYGETCPQYLTLTNAVYKRKDGHLYATCPPVRTPGDNKGLWSALKNHAIQVAATDSCSFTKAQKNTWGRDIEKLYMGIPGTQTLLPLLYTYGVKKNRISLSELVKITALNPAKIMGLYPQKGTIRPGGDADFALINPAKSAKVDYKNLSHNCDYSPYQGMKLYGWPEYTILRGEIISTNGKLAAPENRSGQFLKRKPSDF